MQVFNRYVSTRGLTVFAAELLLISGSVTLAAAVRYAIRPEKPSEPIAHE